MKWNLVRPRRKIFAPTRSAAWRAKPLSVAAGKFLLQTCKQFKKRYSIAYVSRHDLKKFKYQTPGYKLK